MKANIVRILSAVGIGVLIAWGISALSQDPTNLLPLGVVVGIESILLWIGFVGIDFNEYPRSGIMVRNACLLGFIVLLILNTIYAFCGINTSFYVLNGIISLVLLIIITGAYNTKQ